VSQTKEHGCHSPAGVCHTLIEYCIALLRFAPSPTCWQPGFAAASESRTSPNIISIAVIPIPVVDHWQHTDREVPRPHLNPTRVRPFLSLPVILQGGRQLSHALGCMESRNVSFAIPVCAAISRQLSPSWRNLSTRVESTATIGPPNFTSRPTG